MSCVPSIKCALLLFCFRLCLLSNLTLLSNSSFLGTLSLTNYSSRLSLLLLAGAACWAFGVEAKIGYAMRQIVEALAPTSTNAVISVYSGSRLPSWIFTDLPVRARITITALGLVVRKVISWLG